MKAYSTGEDSVVILAGARTAMGSFQGCFSPLSANQLGAAAITGAVQRARLTVTDIDEVLMGCVLTAGLKQGPARQAALQAGLPVSTGCTTINKLCGSGMKALMLAHDSLALGNTEVVVAGGMESMTNAPYLLPKMRQGARIGHDQVLDHLFLDGLEDAETGQLMGSFAEQVANQYGITRQQMDDFAIGSLTKAREAMAAGHLSEEITEVKVEAGKQHYRVTTDEQPAKADLNKIKSLAPAFKPGGTITAASSSSISDGACALVLATESLAKTRQWPIQARLVAHASHALAPGEFTLAPSFAIEKVLKKADWYKDQVDLFEINEAFAMVTLLAMKELTLDPARVNIYGGACALGHPIGATGARIVLTLLTALRQQGKKRGVAALCIGGGEATAIAVELV
jgi:acetyl-CoA C-acetyltransferase